MIELCAKDDVAEGEAIKVEHDDLELAVYHVDGDFYVTDNACTHGPGELSDGFLEGHVIECDFHQGKFDIRDGKVVAPPCVVEHEDLQGGAARHGRRPSRRRRVRFP